MLVLREAGGDQGVAIQSDTLKFVYRGPRIDVRVGGFVVDGESRVVRLVREDAHRSITISSGDYVEIDLEN